MKRSISRFFLFMAAVATGAVCFGLWSANVQAVTTAGGPWCPPNTTASHTTYVDMCYTGGGGAVTVSASPTTQTSYLTAKTGTCGACGTSPTN